MDDEIDMSTVYKQAASNLKTVTNLNDSLSRFGYTKDDRIDRRDMVIMFHTIRTEMEEEIHNLAHDSAYDSAKEMRTRLLQLKNEYNSLQENGETSRRIEQQQLFQSGENQHLNELKRRHLIEEQNILQKCQELKNNLIQTHLIEKENLELKIRQMKKLPTVYSKQTIELLQAESSLIALNDYEEGRKVRQLIDKKLLVEESESEKEYSRRNEMRREALDEAHVEDQARLDEKIKGIIWTDKRRREGELKRFDSSSNL
jgi:hypothetical protein